MDGLSLLLVMLTMFLGLISILASWNEIQHRTGFFHFNLLWVLAGITGVFLAMDLFLFYFFWEVMLIPMYFIIGIWGHENRIKAAYKFFIYTQAGGLLMFIAILAIYVINAKFTDVYTFDYLRFSDAFLTSTQAKWIMGGFLAAFLVKLPAVPLHNWLPDAHTQAPTAGSIILAGLLLKTGAYGIYRFVLPAFPDASAFVAPVGMIVGITGILYGAKLAFAQTDLKRMIAYTSISHMGFVLLAASSFNEMALQGGIMQMLTHGISTGALFYIAGMIQERIHTRDIREMGGFWQTAPGMGGITMVFILASLGLPGLGNFIAEFLILLGTFQVNSVYAVIAALALIASAIYALYLMQKVFHGNKPDSLKLPDLLPHEWVAGISMLLLIIWMGLFPSPFLNTAKHTLINTQYRTEASRVSLDINHNRTFSNCFKEFQSYLTIMYQKNKSND
jgi:NADH-quinone oxidoreductase subunit M